MILTFLSRIFMIILVICATQKLIVLLFGEKDAFIVYIVLLATILFSFLGKKLDEEDDSEF